MTKRIFQECITLLLMAFSQEADKNKLKLYWEYLKDLSDSETKEATDIIIKNNQWFPKIVEIRQTTKEIREKNIRALEAQRIKHALPPPDDRIPISELRGLAKDLVEKLSGNAPQKTKQKGIKLRGRTSPPLTPQEFKRRKAKLEKQKKILGVA